MLKKKAIHKIIAHACKSNSVTELSEKIQVFVSDDLRVHYGSYYYPKKRIYLSRSVFFNKKFNLKRIKNSSQKATPVNYDLFREQYISHLASHIIVHYKWLQEKVYVPFPEIHGKEWQTAMKNCGMGINIASCHIASFQKRSKVRVSCDCCTDIVLHGRLAFESQLGGIECVNCGATLRDYLAEIFYESKGQGP